MERRSHLMELEAEEQADYLAGLHSTYGDEILGEAAGLQTSHQRRYEAVRHRLNSRFLPRSEALARSPRRLLLSITQRCTFACSHCWVFGSPTADCSLSLDELDAIHQHTALEQAPRWTVSGGEFFLLPYFAEALQRYPIDCIYSNGFWGYPKDRCRRYIEHMAAALRANPFVREEMLTLILSYDVYHSEACSQGLPLAKAIATVVAELYEVLPGIHLRISHARRHLEDASYTDVTGALEQEGFTVLQTTRQDRNGNIANLSYRYQRNDGPVKEIFIDTYPIAGVGRSLCGHAFEPSPSAAPGDVADAPPLARYQYALGPDGGVGLYQVLYAPPVPYWLGDLVHEPWKTIARRLAVDPLARTLEEEGTAPILSFLECYYPSLQKSLIPYSTIQQFLYLVLLDPERRLLLNAWLLQRMQERGSLLCRDIDLQRLIGSPANLRDAAGRQNILHTLYEDLPAR